MYFVYHDCFVSGCFACTPHSCWGVELERRATAAQASRRQLGERLPANINRDSFLIVTFCRFLSVRLHFSSSEGIYVMPSHFSASRRGLSVERARLIDERAKINVQLNYSISWKRKLNGTYLCSFAP